MRGQYWTPVNGLLIAASSEIGKAGASLPNARARQRAGEFRSASRSQAMPTVKSVENFQNDCQKNGYCFQFRLALKMMPLSIAFYAFLIVYL